MDMSKSGIRSIYTHNNQRWNDKNRTNSLVANMSEGKNSRETNRTGSHVTPMSTRNSQVKAIGFGNENKFSHEKRQSQGHASNKHRPNISRDFQKTQQRTNIIATGNHIVGGNLKKLPLTTRNAKN